jgi:mono/diheme cytochrome c family protein
MMVPCAPARTIVALAALGLAIRAGAAEAPPAVSDAAQIQAGAALYGQKCTGCHSPTLGEGGHGPALKGEYFRTTWGGQSARKLYGMVVSTMPADNPGSLSPADALALVAFILNSNGFPAGSAALGEPGDLAAVEIAPGP